MNDEDIDLSLEIGPSPEEQLKINQMLQAAKWHKITFEEALKQYGKQYDTLVKVFENFNEAMHAAVGLKPRTDTCHTTEDAPAAGSPTSTTTAKIRGARGDFRDL